MNIVDKVFRARDILFEQEKIAVIMPEEESKKHQREPKLNVNEKGIFTGRNIQGGSGGQYGTGISMGYAQDANEDTKMLGSPQRKQLLG